MITHHGEVARYFRDIISNEMNHSGAIDSPQQHNPNSSIDGNQEVEQLMV